MVGRILLSYMSTELPQNKAKICPETPSLPPLTIAILIGCRTCLNPRCNPFRPKKEREGGKNPEGEKIEREGLIPLWKTISREIWKIIRVASFYSPLCLRGWDFWRPWNHFQLPFSFSKRVKTLCRNAVSKFVSRETSKWF